MSRDDDRDNSSIQLSSLSNSVNLVAISLAIFTFLLFFSTSNASVVQSNSIFFQASLGLVVAAVFSFGVAGLYNFVLIFSTPARHAKLQSHRQRAEYFFAAGLSILLLEPSLILFTLGYPVIALVALIFFLAYMTTYIYESRTLHSIRNFQGANRKTSAPGDFCVAGRFCKSRARFSIDNGVVAENGNSGTIG